MNNLIAKLSNERNVLICMCCVNRQYRVVVVLLMMIELEEGYSTSHIKSRNRKRSGLSRDLNFHDSDNMDPEFQAYYQKAYQKLITDLRDNWQSPITYLKKRGYLPHFKDLEVLQNYYPKKENPNREQLHKKPDKDLKLQDGTIYLITALDQHLPLFAKNEIEAEAPILAVLNNKNDKHEEVAKVDGANEMDNREIEDNDYLDEVAMAEDHNEGLKDRFTGGIGNVIQPTDNDEEALTDNGYSINSDLRPIADSNNWFTLSQVNREGEVILPDKVLLASLRKDKKKYKDDVVFKTFNDENVKMCGPVSATIRFKKPKRPTLDRRSNKLIQSLQKATKMRRHENPEEKFPEIKAKKLLKRSQQTKSLRSTAKLREHRE